MKKEKQAPVQFSIRLYDAKLLDDLRKEAKKNRRTINQHIGWLLENRKKTE